MVQAGAPWYYNPRAGPGNVWRKSAMVEQRLDKSRRKVMGAVVQLVSAGLLLRISQAQAAEKMTRQQAEISEHAKRHL